MKVTPYLSFNGDCCEAFEFYARCLGGSLEAITHGQSPVCDQVPVEWHDKIMHVQLQADDFMLMGSDAPPNMQSPVSGMAVALSLESDHQAERIFNELANDGEIGMAMAPTFWASRFGMVTDRFGIPWLINSFEGVDQCAAQSA